MFNKGKLSENIIVFVLSFLFFSTKKPKLINLKKNQIINFVYLVNEDFLTHFIAIRFQNYIYIYIYL